MFLQVCVILFTGGVPDQVLPPGPGTPPQDQVHPPGTRYTPEDLVHPSDQVHPPRSRYTPLEQVHPPGPGTPPWDQVHPHRTRYPRDQVHPRTRYTPPGDTVYARVVCILLECILVIFEFSRFYLIEMTTSSKVKLSTDHVLKGLNELRNQELLCDVHLVAEGAKFPAHRVVLAAASPYFQAMFTGGFKENKMGEITLNEW